MPPLNRLLKYLAVSLAAFLFISSWVGPILADPASDMEGKVKVWAMECQAEVASQLELLVSSGKLSIQQMFDTFYVPIPNTTPQKFRTQYDAFIDQAIQQILDKYLAKDSRLFFVVAVDRNGYLPTHNARSQDRSKRLFNDRTGLAAARNTEPCLVQKYARDTGETIYDLSVPLFVHKRHWGAIRFGYQP
ncbi:MAG: chemotaxis protein [Desulfobacterales bacterium]|nr:chemotaxis protein [Desulfobacterales bacterium]MBI5897535.1 chemotaxis protein [Desulfobacterales bacterium]